MYQGLSVPSAQEQEMELLSVGAAFLFLALLWVPYRCVYAFACKQAKWNHKKFSYT